MSSRRIQARKFVALTFVQRNRELSKMVEGTNSVTKRILNVSIDVLLLTVLAVAWAITCEAKEPAHFVAADVSKAGNIPYLASSLDAGVVTLSVDLDKTGQVTGVGILRDPAFFPAQLNTATFAPYLATAKTQEAVVLNVSLDMNANVAKVATLRDVPPLTASATGTLKNWNFSAATYKGKPIQSRVVMAFVFRSLSAPLPRN